MKKIKYILLIICLFLLVGCSNDNQEGKTEEKKNTIIAGETLLLAINEKYSLPTDYLYDYTIADESILTIENDEIIGLSEGKTTIKLVSTEKEITYDVTVYQEVITVQEKLIIKKGETVALSYETKSSEDCKIVIEDGTIASVNGNNIYGEKNGFSNITLSSFGVTKTVELEVVDASYLIDFNDENQELLLNDKGLIKISEITESMKAEEINGEYEYSDYDEEIISVSKHGYLETLKSGTTNLKIKNTKTLEEKIVKLTVREKFMEYDVTDEKMINLYGRILKDTKKKTITVYHSGSGFECTFKGSTFKATINSNCTLDPCAYVKVYLDDTSYSLPLDQGNTDYTYTLAEGLSEGFHTIKVVKRTEECYGQLVISNIEVEELYNPVKKPQLKIEVYGDSITSGYGILGVAGKDTNTGLTQDCTSTYAYVASEILNAQINMFCYQGISLSAPGWYDFLMKNIFRYYSNSNHTLWDFSNYVPDIAIIYIGTNDSYGIYTKKNGSVTQFKTDYRFLINSILKNAPNAQVICCYGLLSMNSELEKVIKSMPNLYPDGNVHVIQFASNSSGGSYHPNAAANKTAGELLAQYIQDNILNKTEN